MRRTNADRITLITSEFAPLAVTATSPMTRACQRNRICTTALVQGRPRGQGFLGRGEKDYRDERRVGTTPSGAAQHFPDVSDATQLHHQPWLPLPAILRRSTQPHEAGHSPRHGESGQLRLSPVPRQYRTCLRTAIVQSGWLVLRRTGDGRRKTFSCFVRRLPRRKTARHQRASTNWCHVATKVRRLKTSDGMGRN